MERTRPGTKKHLLLSIEVPVVNLPCVTSLVQQIQNVKIFVFNKTEGLNQFYLQQINKEITN